MRKREGVRERERLREGKKRGSVGEKSGSSGEGVQVRRRNSPEGNNPSQEKLYLLHSAMKM